MASRRLTQNARKNARIKKENHHPRLRTQHSKTARKTNRTSKTSKTEIAHWRRRRISRRMRGKTRGPREKSTFKALGRTLENRTKKLHEVDKKQAPDGRVRVWEKMLLRTRATAFCAARAEKQADRQRKPSFIQDLQEITRKLHRKHSERKKRAKLKLHTGGVGASREECAEKRGDREKNQRSRLWAERSKTAPKNSTKWTKNRPLTGEYVCGKKCQSAPARLHFVRRALESNSAARE